MMKVNGKSFSSVERPPAGAGGIASRGIRCLPPAVLHHTASAVSPKLCVDEVFYEKRRYAFSIVDIEPGNGNIKWFITDER